MSYTRFGAGLWAIGCDAADICRVWFSLLVGSSTYLLNTGFSVFIYIHFTYLTQPTTFNIQLWIFTHS